MLRRVMFPAAIILPLWLMVASSVFAPPAATTFGIVVAAPVAFLALIVVTALISVRHSVRTARAVSWLDAAALTLWWAACILCVLPVPGAAWYGLAVVVFGLAALWSSIWQLWSEAKARMAVMLSNFVPQHPVPQTGQGQNGPAFRRATSGTAGDPEVIVVEEKRRRPQTD